MPCLEVKLPVEEVARTARRAYVAYYESLGEEPPLSWEDLENKEQWRWVYLTQSR